MGMLFSCPFSDSNDLEKAVESVIVKSISFGNNELKTLARSISFNAQNSESAIMKSLGSGKMTVEGSISFKHGESDGVISIESKDAENVAALKLQKVYKSFRTRRKLADCAVLVEQSWWRLLDFAELKHSSVSFFDLGKQETAISRWSRARTRAAKVGKGLLKNDKARKLALQHWLEAIDPRHRYGHNLHFYYEKWLQCQSREPFFYWLDVGEGKEVNLLEKCLRQKLQQQCIKYLGPTEREAYEVEVAEGKFLYKESRELLDTTKESNEAKWIFVLSTSRVLYVGKKKKGTFQHSSFLAGGATSAAGRLIAENGILKAIWPHSGHYRPTKENFQDFILFLKENRVNLDNVKMIPVDQEDLQSLKSSLHVRSNSCSENLSEEINETEISDENFEHSLLLDSKPISEVGFGGSAKEVLSEAVGISNECMNHWKVANGDESKSAAMLNRKSYRLSKKCGVWTSGIGPRISCVRDYPSELQTRVLEEVNLSPRSAACRGSSSSPRSPVCRGSASSPRSPSRLCVMA